MRKTMEINPNIRRRDEPVSGSKSHKDPPAIRNATEVSGFMGTRPGWTIVLSREISNNQPNRTRQERIITVQLDR